MLNPKITVRNQSVEGKGLFATMNISKGEVVWSLDPNEKQLSLAEKNALPENLKKLAFQYHDKYIVVTDRSEYMNHSCDPNTWWTKDFELSAKREINSGEEITYDYSTADVGDWTASWQCTCGAPNCRHIITGTDCLNPEFQNRYRGHLPSWVNKYISESQ